MEEKSKLAPADLGPFQVRKITAEPRVQSAYAAITRAFAPMRESFDKKLAEVLQRNGSRRIKIHALQTIMSEVREVSKPFMACKKGCSNCCYQRVMLSQTEADSIAYRISRPAKQLPSTYQLPDEKTFSPSTPCTFLVNGECSIYNNRPLMCRNQVNLDSDDLLCSFENWELSKRGDPRAAGIPMQAPGPILQVYQQISAGDVIGDIRDFFPPGE